MKQDDMEPLLSKFELNKRPDRLSAWLTDPFSWGFIIIFAAAFVALPDLSSEWLSTILIPLATILAVALVVFLSRKQSPAALEIPDQLWNGGVYLAGIPVL
jgi:hypothetical protein